MNLARAQSLKNSASSSNSSIQFCTSIMNQFSSNIIDPEIIIQKHLITRIESRVSVWLYIYIYIHLVNLCFLLVVERGGLTDQFV